MHELLPLVRFEIGKSQNVSNVLKEKRVQKEYPGQKVPKSVEQREIWS